MSSSFDPKLHTLVFGVLPILGYAENTKIGVKWLGKGAEAFSGIDGDGVVVHSHDKRAEVTIELMATGAGRNTLSALLTYYNQVNIGIPLVMTGIDTGEVFSAPVAYIKNPPDLSVDPNAPKRTIVFICPEASMSVAPDATIPFQALS